MGAKESENEDSAEELGVALPEFDAQGVEEGENGPLREGALEPEALVEGDNVPDVVDVAVVLTVLVTVPSEVEDSVALPVLEVVPVALPEAVADTVAQGDAVDEAVPVQELLSELVPVELPEADGDAVHEGDEVALPV